MDRNFERHIDQQIKEIRSLLNHMGGWVETSLSISMESLFSRNSSLLQHVHESEDRINSIQLEIDAACFNLLAQQAPVAKDLRQILSFLKINSDLERMGDQCSNIAHLAKDLVALKTMAVPEDLRKMLPPVSQMLKESLNAFVREDVELAKKVLLMDDQVDSLKESLQKQLQTEMKRDPELIGTALALIFVTRNLERLGDHATNIAEDVIFVSTGLDIRHRGPSGTISESQKGAGGE